MEDLAKKLIVRVVHADAVTKCQGGVKSKALDVGPDTDFHVGVREVTILVHVSDDAKALQVEHRVITAHGGLRESRASRFALVFATGIPRATANREALSATDNSMESVKLRTVNHSVVVFHKDVAASFERVEHNSTSVAKLDLEDRILVLAPPFLTR